MVAIASFALGALFYDCSKIIFQEGNPWPQIKGVAQLNFTNKEIIALSNHDNKYITRSKNGAEVVKSFMASKGYNFVEQMGSGYLFQSSNGSSAMVIHKYYSQNYSLWSIAENYNASSK